jgi:hypothetical protein
MSEGIRELIDRALAGDLTAEESERLLAACREDEAVRAEFARLAVNERLLHSAYSEATTEIVAREVAQRLRPGPAATDRLVARVARRNRWGLFFPRLSWAAGILLLLGVCAWYGLSMRTAATLGRCEGTRWTGKAHEVGENLRSGQHLTFSSGLIEVAFQDGAVVVLEGPADLEIRGRASAFLHRGRAVARVPEQARGFIIDSPRGRLVDLGTEFGVSVGEAGETEVHVLEGRVDAQLPGRKTAVELRANEALRLTPEPTWLNANENAFVTEMPPRAEEKPPYIHWSFDEGSGRVAGNSGRGLADKDAQLSLRNVLPEAQGPTWVKGPFGNALEFDGKGAFAECKYQGIPGRQARSIAAWVRVPQDFKTEEGYGIVGWGMVNYPGMAWQLSVNPVEEEGLIGRLRIGVSKGAVVGTTDLRDGKWHHLAVVMYGGARPNTATHVLIYVDGVLEPAPCKSVLEIVTNTKKSKHGLWIGRNVATARSLETDFSPGGPFFRGAVDEVFVVSGALSGEQIRRIMQTSRL